MLKITLDYFSKLIFYFWQIHKKRSYNAMGSLCRRKLISVKSSSSLFSNSVIFAKLTDKKTLTNKYYVHVYVHKVSESCFPSGRRQNSQSCTMLFIFHEMFFTCCFHWNSALCLKSVKFLYATVYVRVFQFAVNILTRCQLLLQAYSFRLNVVVSNAI